MSKRASRPSWPLVNTIYCEAKCSDEDVYYVGSDDEQYDSPRQRKIRYEQAGQRFLGGSAPRLLTSSLKGPFESSRGWKNPWASKTEAARIAARSESQASARSKVYNTANPTKRHTAISTAASRTLTNKRETHLPSPQSLKTASLADGHPFLEDEELRVVQEWRRNIQDSNTPAKQQPQQTAELATSRGKRKAGHNWLKTVPDKKQRTERNDRTAERTYEQTGVSNAASGGLKDSRTAAVADSAPITAQEQPTHDVLQPPTRLLQRESTSQLISPPKKSAAVRTPVKPTANSAAPFISEDIAQLSMEQQAAATLSSPVSLQNVKQEKPTAQSSPLKFNDSLQSLSERSSVMSSIESPRRTDLPSTVHENIDNTPHQIEDEEFVFDITLDPYSDSSDGEEDDDETSEEASDSQPQQTLGDDTDLHNDASSDSALTELSCSPDMPDLAPVDEDSDVESELSELTELSDLDEEEAPAAPQDEIPTIPADYDYEVPSSPVPKTIKPRRRPNKAQLARESRLVEESQEAGAVEPAVEPAESPAAPEQTTEAPTSSAQIDLSTADSVLDEAAEQDQDSTEPQEASTIQTASPRASEESEYVDADQDAVADAQAQPVTTAEVRVPPSPRVKQEAGEFSIGALFRSIVPTSAWTQLTQRTTVPVQPAVEQPTVIGLEDQVLPSIEDSFVEETESKPIDASKESGQQGSMADTASDDVAMEETDESGQQLLSEQGSALTSQAVQPDSPPTTTDEPVESVNEEPELQSMIETEQDQTLPTEATEASQSPAADVAENKQLPEMPSTDPAATTERQSTASTPLSVIPATPPRDKTPASAAVVFDSEPRFAVKSFAAFSTPSPERLRIRKRRTLTRSSLRHPSLKGILSLRKPGLARRTNNRVTWALAGDEDAAETDSHDHGVAPAAREGRASPPPRTPLAELATASNDKFGKHFSSVVKRTDGLRHRFHVTADLERAVEPLGVSSQQSTVCSQVSNTAARTNGDVEMKDAPMPVSRDDVENRERPREATMSIEPMDMVEDMMREMGDSWQAWDVDAELNAAKRTQGTGPQVQSAWR